VFCTTPAAPTGLIKKHSIILPTCRSYGAGTFIQFFIFASVSSFIPLQGLKAKKNRLLEAGCFIILFLFYKLVPPPCSAGIIMTITIIITASFVMTLFNLLLNIEGCYYTNIPELKIKNKELFIYFLLLYQNTLLKLLISSSAQCRFSNP